MKLADAITIWNKKEATIEEKIMALRKHIFHRLGMHADPDSYAEKGPILDRFIAGFVDRYIFLTKDLLFIVLDPIHVVDIIISFVKNITTNPRLILKQFWSFWTYYYTHGSYGVGMLVADALLIGMLAGIRAAKLGENTTAIASQTLKTTNQSLVDLGISGPIKGIEMAQVMTEMAGSFKEICLVVVSQPTRIIRLARMFLIKNATFWELRKFKYYAGHLILKDKAV